MGFPQPHGHVPASIADAPSRVFDDAVAKL